MARRVLVLTTAFVVIFVVLASMGAAWRQGKMTVFAGVPWTVMAMCILGAYFDDRLRSTEKRITARIEEVRRALADANKAKQ